MDWFSWLSRTGLDPTTVYEYGVAFAHNELEQDDIPYFNHEFLLSMGISIAKHRLQILKLASKEKPASPHSMSRVLSAIKRSLSKHLRAWRRCEDSKLAIVPIRSPHSSRWRNSMVKRSKKAAARAPLLLTSVSSSRLFHSSRINSFSSPMEARDQRIWDDRKGLEGDGGDEYWPCAVEDIRWDAMFHNLKPT